MLQQVTQASSKGKKIASKDGSMKSHYGTIREPPSVKALICLSFGGGLIPMSHSCIVNNARAIFSMRIPGSSYHSSNESSKSVSTYFKLEGQRRETIKLNSHKILKKNSHHLVIVQIKSKLA